MKQQLLAFGGRLVKKFAKSSPTILIGVGVATGVSAVIFAIKNTPRANDILEEHKAGMEEIEQALEDREINLKEAAKYRFEQRMETAWELTKVYAPTILFEALSISSIIFSHRICLRRQMALAAAAAASEAALGDKILEVEALQKMLPSKKKADEAKTEAVAEKLRNDLPMHPSQIVQTGYGNQLCFDRFAGGWFYGDHETVRQIFGKLEDQYEAEDEINVDDIRQALHLPVQPIHKGITISRQYRQRLSPEFRYIKMEDIVDSDKDIWAKNIPPLTPVLVIDYSDAVIEGQGPHNARPYHYYGDF